MLGRKAEKLADGAALRWRCCEKFISTSSLLLDGFLTVASTPCSCVCVLFFAGLTIKDYGGEQERKGKQK
jgi:hypothetical protein